ncbi:MAG: transposase [Methylovulum sp.]|nr:transposase [Methylovulum sp.]
MHQLINNTKCFETVRNLRWPDGVPCPHCGSKDIARQGKDETQPGRRHQPLKIWVPCLYFTGAPCGYGSEPVKLTGCTGTGPEQR